MTEEKNKYWEQTYQRTELYWRKKMLRGLENFEKSKKVWTQQNKYSRNFFKWKLYFSNLLKEDRTEFLNGLTEK